jgi:tetratricopeptide (TPR) repeat protein
MSLWQQQPQLQQQEQLAASPSVASLLFEEQQQQEQRQRIRERIAPSSPSSVTSMDEDQDHDGNQDKGDHESSSSSSSSALFSIPSRQHACSHRHQESRDDVFFFADVNEDEGEEDVEEEEAKEEEEEEAVEEDDDDEDVVVVSTTVNSPLHQPQEQHHQEQQQPFFVLDWLEDLVPQHQDPQYLAKILKTPDKYLLKQRHKKTEHSNVYRPAAAATFTFSSLSLSSSSERQEPQELSPLQRLFSHWNNKTHSLLAPSPPSTPNNKTSKTSKTYSRSMPDLFHPSLSFDDDGGDQDSAVTCTLPGTPKSSNRKKKRNLSRGGRSDDHQDWDFRGTVTTADLTPTNLTWQLDQAALSPTSAHRWQQRRARRNQQKATPILQRSLGMAKAWNAKGLQAAQHLQWTHALECWDNALEIYTALLGNQHGHVANVQNNRGIALGKLQRTHPALQALHAALAIRHSQWQKAKSNSVASSDDGNDDDDDESSSNSNSSSNDSSDGGNPVVTSSDPVLVVVSTLHNIANVHQEAGDYSQALQVLVQAKQTLWWQDDNPEEEAAAAAAQDNALVHSTTPAATDAAALKWHQAARLCAAMGHVYYQAGGCHWKDAREAYHDALHVYQRLVKSHPQLQSELQAVQADLEELDDRFFLQQGQQEQDDDDQVDDMAPWYYGTPQSAAIHRKGSSSSSAAYVHEWHCNMMPALSQQQQRP